MLPRRILLPFGYPSQMLDTLFGMSTELRRELRYIRVRAFPFTVADEPPYHFAETVKMFSDLQLDQLIVEDVYHTRGWLHSSTELADEGSSWEVFELLETNG